MNAVLVDYLPLPCMITSPENRIVSTNYVMSKMAGNEMIDHKLIEEVFDKWEEFSEGKLIHAQIVETNCIFLKGQLEESDHYIYVGTFSSELVSLTEKLKEAEKVNRELDAIIENSYDGIYITDNKGVTLKTNPAIERITGIPKEYYIGKNVNNLIKRGILQSSVTHKVLEKKRSVSVVQLNYSGSETLLTGNPVFNEQGEIESVVTNIRDLSELNHLQAALKEANKLNDSYKKEIERLKGKNAKRKNIVMQSEQMKYVYETAARVVNVDATVLILGETGVGKDVLARYIYNSSTRAETGKFIKVNCGAIPPDLLESELFGYEGGAFTGANLKGKQGMFELADKGVLFLDEIGEMPVNLQVKLLRVLQEQEIQRIGAVKTKKVNVRIIAATNRDLKEMVGKGEFREDLFYRLNVVPITIPPLRERREDILPLIQFFLEQLNHKYGKEKFIDQELKEYFFQYKWPGNVRELSNLLERMVLVNEENILTLEHLPFEYKNKDESIFQVSQMITLKEAVELAEEKVLSFAARKYKTTYEIAEALQTSQPTVVRKLKKYQLKIEE